MHLEICRSLSCILSLWFSWTVWLFGQLFASISKVWLSWCILFWCISADVQCCFCAWYVWCDILMLLLAQSQIWNDVFLVYILPKLHLKNLHMTHHPWLVLQEKDIFSFLVQMMLSKHRKPCASQKPIHYLLVSFARKGYVSFILFRSSDTVKT